MTILRHTVGNSLLFLPNVLKVYLENGQTKAFKFEATTTVKDIVLTLKEKLSIRCIEHFALVVQRKDAHDYRCLLRVCFMARDPVHMLHEDPVAFEYLYLQLQDRESMVSLLVGAKYGVSQVINHKLNITTTLTEFSSVSRVELLPESDKVSVVKIYLQDIKPITLMLESQAAKDLCCLVSGYCKLLVDPTLSVFSWTGSPKEHRISAE
ncbi:hypothetical protein JZ751_016458, partial [Albula glossodonta]